MSAVEQMDATTISQLLRGIEIPPQPQMLQLISAEKKKEYPDLKKIAAAISKDVALSAAMLRAANSPAFATRGKVTSIHNAVLSLGTKNVIGLVTGLSLRMALAGKGKVNLDRFWDTAADTAIICSVLASKFRVFEPDFAYMLGLFHDVGMALMIQKFPNYLEILRKENLAENKEPITAIEDRHFNTNHTVVGYIVSRSWALPDTLRETILLHHNDEAFATSGALAKQVGLLTLSEYFCALAQKRPNDHMWHRFGPVIIELFTLTESDIEDLQDEMGELLSGF